MRQVRRFGRTARRATLLAGAAVALIALAAAANAQSPFGVGTPDTPSGMGWTGPFAEAFAWVAARQAEFYRALTGAIGRLKEDGTAIWFLGGVSFAYGVLHAAGPGHGKAVISAYLLSSGETLRRGVAIAFTAALVQGLVAIGLVAVAAGLLRVTAFTMTAATDWLEIASYGLIALIGAVLLVQRLRGGGHDRHDHEHDHHHDHGHDDHHGHLHAPPPDLVAGRMDLRRAAAAVAAMGVRPCSGAVIVLVFALAQGLFMAGVVSALVMALGTGIAVALIAAMTVSARGLALRLAGGRSDVAGRIVWGLGVAGASAMLLLGLLLLGGKLAAGMP